MKSKQTIVTVVFFPGVMVQEFCFLFSIFNAVHTMCNSLLPWLLIKCELCFYFLKTLYTNLSVVSTPYDYVHVW